MTINKAGGNRWKKYAKKNEFNNKKNKIRTIEDSEFEVYGQCVKVCGGNKIEVIDTHGNTFMSTIPGKFRGRGRRDNFISANTWLLIGLREYNKKESDVIVVYSNEEVERLKQDVPYVDWSRLPNNINSSKNPIDDSIIFDSSNNDFNSEIVIEKKTNMFKEEDEINVDDI